MYLFVMSFPGDEIIIEYMHRNEITHDDFFMDNF